MEEEDEEEVRAGKTGPLRCASRRGGAALATAGLRVVPCWEGCGGRERVGPREGGAAATLPRPRPSAGQAEGRGGMPLTELPRLVTDVLVESVASVTRRSTGLPGGVGRLFALLSVEDHC